jgi:hypothetical protein
LAGKYVIAQLPSDFKLPIVLHYVDSRGKIWGGGRVPRGPVGKFNIFDLAIIKGRTDEMPLSEDSTSSKGAEPGESALIWRKLPETPLISVGALASARLQPVGPRVHLASASWAFEEAAVAMLRKKPFGRKHSEKVCKLLVFSINHDVFYKGKRSRPHSYRLYDLLAGVCVRFRQDTYFEEMLRVIDATGQEGLFRTRIAKWNDPQGSWRKRWRNRQRHVKWISTSGGVVF